MSKSRKLAGRFIPITLTFIAAAFASNAHAGQEQVSLLNSLLERGLIAPEDYAAEMKREAPIERLALATSDVQQVRQNNVRASDSDTMVDYQFIVAMNEGGESSHSSGHHDGDHHDGGHHDSGEHGGHNHFEGAYAVVTQEWKSPSVLVDGEKIKVSENAPSFAVGYNFALSADTTLGIKATIDFKSGEFGSGDISGTEKKVLEKSHYSLAVEPGYVLNDETLVFGILAYHHARTGFEDSAQLKGISGVGYGIGFKRTLASHVFLMGEIQQVKYGQTTVDGSTIKPTSNTVALGLGYHF